jgi:DNA-binding response OmpR family regulator
MAKLSHFKKRSKKKRPAARSRKRVLFLDDDKEIWPFFEMLFLEFKRPPQVEWVTSGEEAIQKLDEARERFPTEPYDLVIADIFLEGKVTGVDFWNVCRSAYPNMAVVVMSALPLHKFYEFIGRDTISPQFLKKPLDIKECRMTVRSMLGEADQDGVELTSPSKRRGSSRPLIRIGWPDIDLAAETFDSVSPFFLEEFIQPLTQPLLLVFLINRDSVNVQET